MHITRRHFVGGAGLAALAVQFPSLALARQGSFIDLVAGPSQQAIFQPDGPASDLWTYNGSAPGPEIRVRRGERVRVRLTNNLEEPTSLHWHGIRIDNAMDGVAGLTQEPIEPGESFEYDFVAPDAGTYWYHAHNKSWNQVARGLYGPLIVDEDEVPFDRAHDLTLVIDDWRLAGEGTLDVASLGSLMDWSHDGRLGNWLTVNGRAMPVNMLNAGEPYRLRLINASNARILEIDPNRFDAKVIAYDGQALPEPVRLTYAPLMVGPAQRVDLLIVPQAGSDFVIEELSGDTPFAFAGFEVRGETANGPGVPSLPVNDLPEPELAGARTVRVEMTGGAMGNIGRVTYNGKVLEGSDFRDTGQVWAFNGIANLPETPLYSAQRGETIVIETVNNTAFVHAMHVHGHHFRVIERSGSEIDVGQPWRDTFLVGPQQTTRIAFVADNPGKWLYHCHMLEHAAGGMNTWFEVT
ncbi:multicopper oxidase family protein [Oceaniradius stylonematis]|uniref:multicopper oxidase family protein n=1 Tax=Oceaniradius stylonematis TaxID=2184161 RepID=UPI0035CF4E45